MEELEIFKVLGVGYEPGEIHQRRSSLLERSCSTFSVKTLKDAKEDGIYRWQKFREPQQFWKGSGYR